MGNVQSHLLWRLGLCFLVNVFLSWDNENNVHKHIVWNGQWPYLDNKVPDNYSRSSVRTSHVNYLRSAARNSTVCIILIYYTYVRLRPKFVSGGRISADWHVLYRTSADDCRVGLARGIQPQWLLRYATTNMDTRRQCDSGKKTRVYAPLNDMSRQRQWREDAAVARRYACQIVEEDTTVKQAQENRRRNYTRQCEKTLARLLRGSGERRWLAVGAWQRKTMISLCTNVSLVFPVLRVSQLEVQSWRRL